jgi:hypothetical protein
MNPTNKQATGKARRKTKTPSQPVSEAAVQLIIFAYEVTSLEAGGLTLTVPRSRSALQVPVSWQGLLELIFLYQK